MTRAFEIVEYVLHFFGFLAEGDFKLTRSFEKNDATETYNQRC